METGALFPAFLRFDIETRPSNTGRAQRSPDLITRLFLSFATSTKISLGNTQLKPGSRRFIFQFIKIHLILAKCSLAVLINVKLGFGLYLDHTAILEKEIHCSMGAGEDFSILTDKCVGFKLRKHSPLNPHIQLFRLGLSTREHFQDSY
jgi:hypothetical protein